MRAYRPSRFGDQRYDEEQQRGRQEKLRLYAQRARAGQPLFDPAEQRPSSGQDQTLADPPRD